MEKSDKPRTLSIYQKLKIMELAADISKCGYGDGEGTYEDRYKKMLDLIANHDPPRPALKETDSDISRYRITLSLKHGPRVNITVFAPDGPSAVAAAMNDPAAKEIAGHSFPFIDLVEERQLSVHLSGR